MNAVLLIVIPLLVAFLSILSKKYAPYLLVAVSLFNIVSIYFLEVGIIEIGGFTAPYGINLIVNQYSITGLFIVNTLFFIVVALTIANYKKMSSILLVALAGLNGLLLTGDLFNLFVFIEIVGISAYLITTTNKKPLSTFNYLVAGTVGSVLYLLGLIILYSMFGTLNMADMHERIIDSGASAVAVSFPFLLMFIGLSVEAKLLPFNSWAKSVLGNANTLSGTMIASVFAAAITLTVGRLLNGVFVFSDTLGMIVLVVVLFSIIAGEAMAYASTKVREILLFSSIAQAGIAIAVFFMGLPGLGVLIVGANAITKLVLFIVFTTVSEQVGSDEVNELKGIFGENKVIGVGVTASILSVLGLPLFFGFVVKLQILSTLFDNGEMLLPIVILISSVIEGVYFIKLLIKLWYPEGEVKSVSFDITLKYVVVIVAIGLVFFGIVSGDLLDLATEIGGIYNG
jgi:multicomponent Na+:H+ antiporter subunit D